MPPVQLGLDVGHHFDPVDHQIADQPVDDGVLHHHPDQTGPSQVALAELGVRQVLSSNRHAGQSASAYRHVPALADPGAACARSRAALDQPGEAHDPEGVSAAYLVSAAVLQL